MKDFIVKSLIVIGSLISSLFLFFKLNVIEVNGAEYVTDKDIFETVINISGVTLNADPLNNNRSIAVYKVEFENTYSELTITFDDVIGLSDGNPAIYFDTQPTTFPTINFLRMNINDDGGIGNNLFYYNSPVVLSDNKVHVHISIDRVLDPNYIDSFSAIINGARFSFMEPYTFTKHVGLYSDSELLELVLIGRSTGYNDGLDDGYNDGYNDGLDYGYNYGYDDGLYDGYNDGYNEGYYLGVNTNVDATNLFKNVISGISGIFQLEIFPGATIGVLFMIPFSFAIFRWFMRMFGGR